MATLLKTVVRAVHAADGRLGVPLEPWSSRAVKEKVCEALIALEDREEAKRGTEDHLAIRAELRRVRRKLEAELWP